MASRLQCSSYACISISIVNPAFRVFSLCQVLVWNNFTTSLWDFSPGLGFQSGEETFGQNLLGCFIYYSAKLILPIYWTGKILKNIIFFPALRKKTRFTHLLSLRMSSHQISTAIKQMKGISKKTKVQLNPAFPCQAFSFTEATRGPGRGGGLKYFIGAYRWKVDIWKRKLCINEYKNPHNISTSRNQATFLGNINHKL